MNGSILHFVEALPERVKGVIYLSSTGIYGRRSGEWVDESTSPSPKGLRAKARLAAEEEYQKVDIPAIALRLSAIYGPGRGLINALKAGRYRLTPGRFSNRIHVADIAKVITKLILELSPGEWPECLNVSDQEPELIERVVEYYCDKLDLPKPSEITTSELKKRGAETLLSNQRVSSRLLESALNFSFLFPSYKSHVCTIHHAGELGGESF